MGRIAQYNILKMVAVIHRAIDLGVDIIRCDIDGSLFGAIAEITDEQKGY